ncbi:hypothetical protein [Methylobacterium sp. Leaf106]|uniref:hypothetical protein n=1 Tax=Methylobacterium sp. Leaf106 TaxID=1736255 RepID=UPI0006FB4AB3|nr:hypothetical protein [Methylobacterium sp. Leaf106]KQP42062.1 hypothetical protein ASF34_10150 [Methylobacterium sp. Leaf106]
MTTKQQIKGLYAPLLQANPDLLPAGRNRVWLKPVGPVGRMIFVDRISNPAVCVVSWHLVRFFMHETRSWQDLGRGGDEIQRSGRFPGGYGWFWSDPTIYEDFVFQIDAVAFSALRPLDTGRKCLEFLRTHRDCACFLNKDWHLAACIALDEIEKAQEIWASMRPFYFNGYIPENAFEQQMHDRLRLLDEPLRAADRDALFEILRRWEAETIVGSPLEPYWSPGQYPF